MRQLEIDWLKVVAGALAAVASAVVLSTLGAAGTLIGAAVGSMVVTVGSALLTAGLTTSRQTLARAQATALHKVGVAQAEVRRAGRADDTRAQESHLQHADERLAAAHQDLDDAAAAVASTGWRTRLAALPWKRVALTAAALFAVAVVAITVFELLAGRSVSDYTGGTSGDGGTTFGEIGGSSPRKQQPSGPATPTEAPTDAASPDGSGASPTGPAPTTSEAPSEAPGPTPSETPSESPSQAPSETPTLPGPSETVHMLPSQ